jgi:hypothetical protein
VDMQVAGLGVEREDEDSCIHIHENDKYMSMESSVKECGE